jgi:hypothetical protein
MFVYMTTKTDRAQFCQASALKCNKIGCLCSESEQLCRDGTAQGARLGRGSGAPLSWRGRFATIVVLPVLMCAGAAGAGWMLREPLTRTLTRWNVLH